MKDDDSFHWGLVKKIFFRFVFSYLFIYNLSFLTDLLSFGSLSQIYVNFWEINIHWIWEDLFNLNNLPLYNNSSGDATFNFILTFCYLFLSVLCTIIWSFIDRRNQNYSKLYQLLKFYIRLVLAGTLIMYGSYKIIPTQFFTISLQQLVMPFGNSTPMGLLWRFMAFSTTYTIFTGIIEFFTGILLLFPRLTTLGALISVGVFSHVFLLNISYDVPVKLYSFHLLLMSFFLFFDDIHRLINFFILNRPVAPINLNPLSSNPFFNKILITFQIIFGLWFGYNALLGSFEGAKKHGFLAEKSPYYGIWKVEEFIVNGEVKPPLLTDSSRWHQVIFERPDNIIVHNSNGSFESFLNSLDQENMRMKLSKYDDPDWSSQISIILDSEQQNKMILEGLIDGKQIKSVMYRLKEAEFELINRGFHWVNEYPHNY